MWLQTAMTIILDRDDGVCCLVVFGVLPNSHIFLQHAARCGSSRSSSESLAPLLEETKKLKTKKKKID